MEDVYTHGHHASVLRSHKWRTAENSAAYLLGSLHAGDDLLDVGCGPGTITLDLARRLAPGQVVGVDRSPEALAEAQAALAATPTPNVRFAVGDAYALDFPDTSFDVVHAHQLLQHLTAPVAALAELRRVLRPGGTLGVRDGDYATFAWAPDDPVMDRWLSLYHEVTRRNGAEADAGRHLPEWVRAAGFGDVVATSSTWTFADAESRAWWGDLWADRVVESAFAEQAVAYGLADTAALSQMAGAWRRWAASPGGFMAMLHGEVVARRVG